MEKITGQWKEVFNGEVMRDPEIVDLPSRETAKLHIVTLPGGAVIRLKRFDGDGKVITRWSHWYGFTDRKCIDLCLGERPAMTDRERKQVDRYTAFLGVDA